MSNLKEHRTPGPYKFYELDGARPVSDGLGYIRPVADDGREISHHGDGRRSPLENRANGFLLAASWDLYELVSEALAVAETRLEHLLLNPISYRDDIRQLKITIDRYKAVIVAADGETHE